jgi:hypothetical protein
MNANASHDAIDHTIDRALSALRDVQPRHGNELFAGRILAALEHRTAAPQPARFHISAHVALWSATSAAILAIASLIILHQHRAPAEFARAPQTHISPAAAESAQLRVTQISPLKPGFGSPQTSIEPARRMAHRLVNANVAMPMRCTQSGCPIHDEDSAVMNGVSQTPSDAQALADLHAPSHPAPPLPLTPQEKLFLRMLRYGDATQLAELNPMVRAKQDADETAAFKAFFPDPPPLQQPNGDTE